jgi:hypothetical protein
MDLHFWDELLQGLSAADLDWLEARIKRRKESMHPERIERKAIIRANIEEVE